jgi:hypothetical protein
MTRFAPRSIVDDEGHCADDHARRLRLSSRSYKRCGDFVNRVTHRGEQL